MTEHGRNEAYNGRHIVPPPGTRLDGKRQPVTSWGSWRARRTRGKQRALDGPAVSRRLTCPASDDVASEWLQNATHLQRQEFVMTARLDGLKMSTEVTASRLLERNEAS